MRPAAHVVTSGIISAVVGVYFKSFGCAVLSFVAGVFIDLDHLIDYYTNYKFTLRFKRIYCACARARFKRLYVVLHSYELVLVLWIAIVVFGLSNTWKAVAIGITQHMLFDQFTNPLNRFGYFISYRAANGFRKDRIIHKDFLKCPR